MSGLSEQYVQRKAQAYLERRYRTWGKALFSKMEVKTKKAFGGKRADGLIAFRRLIWGTYVVSMEAKSYKTLNAILPYRSIGKWFFTKQPSYRFEYQDLVPDNESKNSGIW